MKNDREHGDPSPRPSTAGANLRCCGAHMTGEVRARARGGGGGLVAQEVRHVLLLRRVHPDGQTFNPSQNGPSREQTGIASTPLLPTNTAWRGHVEMSQREHHTRDHNRDKPLTIAPEGSTNAIRSGYGRKYGCLASPDDQVSTPRAPLPHDHVAEGLSPVGGDANLRSWGWEERENPPPHTHTCTAGPARQSRNSGKTPENPRRKSDVFLRLPWQQRWCDCPSNGPLVLSSASLTGGTGAHRGSSAETPMKLRVAESATPPKGAMGQPCTSTGQTHKRCGMPRGCKGQRGLHSSLKGNAQGHKAGGGGSRQIDNDWERGGPSPHSASEGATLQCPHAR